MLEKVWKKGKVPLAMLVGMQIDTATIKKLGIRLPDDPAILLVGIYPKETIIEKNKCTPMFTEALFTIDRTWKQPRCLWTNEWIKK